MPLETKTEILCNLRGLDPNDDASWEATMQEIINNKIDFQE